MERREFGKIAAAGALLMGTGGKQAQAGQMKGASTANLGRPPMKWGIKHSLQISNLRPETLQLAKQLGMEWVRIGAISPVTGDAYKEVVHNVEAAGLKVSKIGCRVHNPPEIVLNLPGRDEKIEEFKQHLRALKSVGIAYHLYGPPANGVWRTSRTASARGGAVSTAYDESKPFTPDVLSTSNVTYNRAYTEDELWKNWEYFAKQIAPVAKETGVHIGVHPDDPPGLTLGNVPRPMFSSFEGYRRAIEIADSPYIGMGLCVGCWLEGGPRMGRNVLETIEYFGGLKKLFVIHFRNVQGYLPRFYETYLNDGYMDMYQVMRALRKVNFEGVLVGDHFPRMVESAGPLAGQIYTIGYIQALIERANEESIAGTLV